MPTLSDILAAQPKRGQVIDDAVGVLDAEVSDKSGISGLAIKAAVGVIKGIKPGFVRDVVDALLDDFLKALDPIYQEAVAAGKRPGDHLRTNSGRVADALLAITDARVQRTDRAIIKSTYDKLRGSAKKQVEAAAPRLATLIDKHTAG